MKTSEELAAEVADNFIITFHKDADGGPQHLMSLLEDYAVVLKDADGNVLAEGAVFNAGEYSDDGVTLSLLNSESGFFDGERVTVPYALIREVMYL